MSKDRVIKFLWTVRNLFVSRSKEEKELIKRNKKLIKEFPFLLPKNRFSDKTSLNYDYTWTELDAMDTGWRNSFGLEMCKKLKENLVKANYLHKYRITQIKEKYGTLRWYDNSVPESIAEEHERIINYYEDKSKLVCRFCGKQSNYVTLSWVEHVCEDCLKETLKKWPNTEYQELTWAHIPQRTYYYYKDRVRREDSQLKGEMMVAWKRYSKHNNQFESQPEIIEEETTVKMNKLW